MAKAERPPPQLHIRIFLSWPGDVAEERDLARRLLKAELPYDPVFRGRVTCDVGELGRPGVGPAPCWLPSRRRRR